jgi:hypothetical protein
MQEDHSLKLGPDKTTRPYLKNKNKRTKTKQGWRPGSSADNLASKSEALSSNHSNTKKTKTKTKGHHRTPGKDLDDRLVLCPDTRIYTCIKVYR